MFRLPSLFIVVSYLRMHVALSRSSMHKHLHDSMVGYILVWSCFHMILQSMLLLLSTSANEAATSAELSSKSSQASAQPSAQARIRCD